MLVCELGERRYTVAEGFMLQLAIAIAGATRQEACALLITPMPATCCWFPWSLPAALPVRRSLCPCNICFTTHPCLGPSTRVLVTRTPCPTTQQLPSRWTLLRLLATTWDCILTSTSLYVAACDQFLTAVHVLQHCRNAYVHAWTLHRAIEHWL